MKIGFVGLGQMGSAMAHNLLSAGHEVTVYNRSADKTEPLVKAGATAAESPAKASASAEIVFSMVANDEALEALAFGEKGILAGLSTDGVHLSCSTISVKLARKLADEFTRSQRHFLSTPVFGRPDAAAGKKLVFVCGGDPKLIDKVRPVLESLGRAVYVAGQEPWQANLFKLSGNFMLSSMVETFGEVFATVRKAGADPREFFNVITDVFASPVYKNYGTIILDQKYNPAAFVLKLGFKDLRLMMEAAQDLAVPLPIASAVRDQYLSALANGQEDLDWASVAKVAARNAGLSES